MWWTRSPHCYNDDGFCVVLSDGNAYGDDYASGNDGVCFCFCI
jgi:hypothetical protein